jgi:hypothetical protein
MDKKKLSVMGLQIDPIYLIMFFRFIFLFQCNVKQRLYMLIKINYINCLKNI